MASLYSGAMTKSVIIINWVKTRSKLISSNEAWFPPHHPPFFPNASSRPTTQMIAMATHSDPPPPGYASPNRAAGWQKADTEHGTITHLVEGGKCSKVVSYPSERLRPIQHPLIPITPLSYRWGPGSQPVLHPSDHTTPSGVCKSPQTSGQNSGCRFSSAGPEGSG
jgi:hypothetical protein